MISLILASILCAGTAVSGEEKNSNSTSTVRVASNSFKLGTEVVQTVRAEYAEGSYKEFLENMDHDYEVAKKESALEGLIEIRKEGARAQIHPEFARSYRVIQDLKNEQLLSAIKGSDEAEFVQKVRSAAASVPALDDAIISLSGKVPGSGKNADENTLIDLDLEYYYKSIHLDSSNQKDRKDKHIALEMEKADRMLVASEKFEDKALKKAVEQHAKTLDERLSRNYDMLDLQDLARGKLKPATSVEKEVATVISKAQSELAELHRHLLDSLDGYGQAAQK